MENNQITLAELMKPALLDKSTVLTDGNGIFEVENSEDGCCLRIKTKENCTSYIMSAIANYAQNHSDFNPALVTIGEPVENNEKQESERRQFAEKFTLMDTNGGKMIFNKSENKAFTFSYLDDNGQQVDVMEMKFCRALPDCDCVYGFSLDEEFDDMKIGLVDVQTGTVIKPMFSEIRQLDSLEYVGLAFEEYGGYHSAWFKINTFNGLAIKEIGKSKLNCINGKYHYGGAEIDISERNDFFENDDCSMCSCSDSIEYYLSKAPRLFSWATELVIDFSNEEKIDEYFRKDHLQARDLTEISFCGEKIDRLVPLRRNEVFAGINYDNMRWKLFASDRPWLGYEFTAQPKSISDNLFVVEIYAKLGVVLVDDGCVFEVLLPIEFSSIEYYEKGGKVQITDSIEGEQSIYVKYSGMLVEKFGMCAWFNYDGKQITHFVRKECIKYIPSDD